MFETESRKRCVCVVGSKVSINWAAFVNDRRCRTIAAAQSLYQLGVVLWYRHSGLVVNWVEIWKQTESQVSVVGGVVEWNFRMLEPRFFDEREKRRSGREGYRYSAERPRAAVYDFDTRDDGRLYRSAGDRGGSYFSAVIRNNIAIYVRTAEPISGSLLRNASPCSSFNLDGTGTRRIRPGSLWFRRILFAISSSNYLSNVRRSRLSIENLV